MLSAARTTLEQGNIEIRDVLGEQRPVSIIERVRLHASIQNANGDRGRMSSDWPSGGHDRTVWHHLEGSR